MNTLGLGRFSLTSTEFRGATINLKLDGRYENLEQMGLNNPVKSFRNAPDRGFSHFPALKEMPI